MSNRPILSGAPTVEVDQERYDELVRHEALLEVIKKCYSKTTGYSFHEVVGFLFSELKEEPCGNDS